MDQIDAYLEIVKKKTFAGALDWPGWCRSGRNESDALQALLDYAPRYLRVVEPARLGFQPPAGLSALSVVERLEGNATTEFGAPAVPPSIDAQPVDAAELRRLLALLEACWQALDAAALAAAGKELRKGPRGGGRELDGIISHVVGGDDGYLSALGWKFKRDKTDGLEDQLRKVRQAVRDGLSAAAHGELPALSSRGKPHWSPRYFVRRSAWHVLDHAWEIEDRVV